MSGATAAQRRGVSILLPDFVRPYNDKARFSHSPQRPGNPLFVALWLCARQFLLLRAFAPLRETPLPHHPRRHILRLENPHHLRLRREGAHVTPDPIRGRQRRGRRTARHQHGSDPSHPTSPRDRALCPAPSAIMRSRCWGVRMTWPVMRIMSVTVYRVGPSACRSHALILALPLLRLSKDLDSLPVV